MNETGIVVRFLELEKDDFQVETLFRLKKEWILEFRSGTSLFGTHYKIFTNHPLNSESVFRRVDFNEIPWQKSTQSADPTAFFAVLKLVQAGSFEYFYEDVETHTRLGSGYFVVDPVLKIPAANGAGLQALPLDSIVLQTVVTKLLGPLNEWRSRIRVAKESGYNMIHFTPIQELGISNSAYAIADQLKVASSIASSMQDVHTEIKRMFTEDCMLSIVDIVLNHTASSSPWLKEHPEATFNLANSPHLRSAFLLDFLLRDFSREVGEGKWTNQGIPVQISQGSQLDKIKDVLWQEVFPKGKIHEFALLDSAKLVQDFRKLCQTYKPYDQKFKNLQELAVLPESGYGRFSYYVDLEAARAFFKAPVTPGDPKKDERIDVASNEFQRWLDAENGRRYEMMQSHLGAAVNGLAGCIWYERLQQNGPHYGTVTKQCPLFPTYFHTFEDFNSFEEAEAATKDPNRNKLIMAHNGWVMSFDPLKNFAANDCNVYLRRELIPWTDNVKLRYGETPEDCPYLWSKMRDYVSQMSSIFHGVRLDNAHSTPTNVAQYMLDAGRETNPDLYVIAELFTGSEGRDNIFVNRLGITSLVREGMAATDSHDLGRYVHRYCGDPVGALAQLNFQKLKPCMTHALFYDQTHDNPSMIKKHSLADVLPSAAVVSMAFCASGSTRGYDELVPFGIDIVQEKRRYRSFTTKASGSGEVDFNTGILGIRLELNRLHVELTMTGYSQIFVDQMDPNTMAITRHNPDNHSSVIAVIRNCFYQPSVSDFKNAPFLRPIEIEGTLENIIIEACLIMSGESAFSDSKDFIMGLSGGFETYMSKDVDFSKSRFMKVDEATKKAFHKRQLNFSYFPPGALVIFRTNVGAQPAEALAKIKASLGTASMENLGKICKNLSMSDFNRILFRTSAEERDDGLNGGSYAIPKLGEMPYCGLQSFASHLERIRTCNDLGHPLCENLRAGNWMMEYISSRLLTYEETVPVACWLDDVFASIKNMPRYLVPQYFDAVIKNVYDVVVNAALMRLGPFISNGSAFTKQLALGTYQMCGIVMSSKMPPLCPKLVPPLPPKIKHPSTKQLLDAPPSMAAGHAHFSVGWARCWGRDTFISMRGLLLLTQQFQEARFIILAFGQCLRHGLIPNLLSEGVGARFNARDAIWWWLYAIQHYVSTAPDGHHLFSDLVSRIFVKDDSPPAKPGEYDQPLHQVIQEALTKHIQGLNFRERNAGWNLDREMCSEGFNNGIGVDLATGFVYGGNPHNCGTWMDKMGSSEPAGTKGKPATPRDGSAVELVALSYSVIDWLSKISKEGKYPTDCVKWKNNTGQERSLRFEEWAKLIKSNFESRFFVGDDCSADFIRKDLVHTKPMYKDTYGSFHFWADYQVRPNVCVAMVVAPDIFDVNHAWAALDIIQQRLIGPLGMKTLDPKDWVYDGNYSNNDQSTDPKRAHGFNYHQGPEWVWPMGYFLRAKLIFAERKKNKELLSNTVRYVQSVLANHYSHLKKSDWKGLPELTNADGVYCAASCETQAWSMASILETLHQLQQVPEE